MHDFAITLIYFWLLLSQSFATLQKNPKRAPFINFIKELIKKMLEKYSASQTDQRVKQIHG